MLHISNNPKHSIYDELNTVHDKMMLRYNFEKEGMSDVAKAKEMEKFLRMFKYVGNHPDLVGKSSIQLGLEVQAMQHIIQEVGVRLGIGSYNLFKNKHFWYAGKEQQRWGADDVFEAELTSLLQVAAEKASGKIGNKINSGVELLGNIPANISAEYMKTLSNQGQQIINSTYKNSNLISVPKWRSQKVDMSGYSSDFQISSTISPEWQYFIQLFTDVKCTLKNYASDSKYETIHLGNSNITKSLLASLSDVGIGEKEAIHIYYHALAYQDSPEASNHILHLRFAYELAGGGLYDSSGNRLDSADFFIYNDPASDNIWVRSTKEMIYNITKYIGNMSNNINSEVIILKNSFN